MQRKVLVLMAAIILMAATSLISACNTMEGMGRDMSAAGDALTGSANDAKGY